MLNYSIGKVAKIAGPMGSQTNSHCSANKFPKVMPHLAASSRDLGDLANLCRRSVVVADILEAEDSGASSKGKCRRP